MTDNPYNLSPELLSLAARLAERHLIPVSPYTHPKVFVPDGKGGVDEWMTSKLNNPEEPHYVPYCMKNSGCMRVRRTEWGFQCPNCGNEMNWDLTHWNGNADVMFQGEPPAQRAPAAPVVRPLSASETRKQWNERVERKKRAREQRRLNEKD